jgi:uncharacterized protein (DUF2336 family)
MSKIKPILDEIEASLASGNVRHRLKLLQHVTDLFVAGSRRYSGAEIALFDDVLMRLATEIEIEARKRLAQRLAALPDSPPKLIRRLSFDDAIAVAGPVLVASPQLSDADLVENAATKSQDHLYAIAQRLQLSEAVTDILVERGDRRVVRRTARNAGARFSLAGYQRVVEHAHRDRKLALTVAQRSDIPHQCFLKLLETASAEVRRSSRRSTRILARIRKRGARLSSSLQGAPLLGNKRACASALPAIREDCDRLVDARPVAHRNRRTSAARQGHRDDPHSRQGRRLLLDHDQSDADDACRGPRPFEAGNRGRAQVLRAAQPGDGAAFGQVL